MRDFFQIKEDKYRFEVWDLTALVTIVNVALILCGISWAGVIGLLNCAICLVVNVKNRTHINSYITQLALVILNIYFLTL